VRTTTVRTPADLKKLEVELQKSGHTVVWVNETAFRALKNGKVVKYVKVMAK